MESFWLALAMLLLVEGIGPLLFPNKWRGYLARLAQEPVGSLRQIGMVLCGAAIFILLFLT
jgi:uncharacterized protein YjeT (DUF2065 family)